MELKDVNKTKWHLEHSLNNLSPAFHWKKKHKECNIKVLYINKTETGDISGAKKGKCFATKEKHWKQGGFSGGPLHCRPD